MLRARIVLLSAMAIVIFILFGMYFIALIGLIIGWNFSCNLNEQRKMADKFISVIIPIRNEAQSIDLLLHDLMQQRYQTFEVIIVDDHSEDGTFSIVSRQIIADTRFKIVSANEPSKKHALTQGINLAKGEIIVTTDGDCRVGKNWLVAINESIQEDNIMMVFGGVRIIQNDSFFSSLQALEFCSLIGTGAATLSLGFSTMCNGANLAFRKSAYEAVGGYAGNVHIPSGDDEFLMRKIVDAYSGSIRFMHTADATVSTRSQYTIGDFINQRIRWSGKWKYQRVTSKTIAFLVFLFNLAVLCIPFLFESYPYIVISLLLFKIVVEFYFLHKVSSFLQVRWNWLAFILLQFVYPFYVVFIGLVSHFQSFTWKGRRLKSVETKLATIPDID